MVGEYRFSTVEPIAVRASCYAVDTFSRRHLKDRNHENQQRSIYTISVIPKSAKISKKRPQNKGAFNLVQLRPATSPRIGVD